MSMLAARCARIHWNAVAVPDAQGLVGDDMARYRPLVASVQFSCASALDGSPTAASFPTPHPGGVQERGGGGVVWMVR